MKSSYFLGNGQFEVREEPIPALGPADVLVQVAACGVCGTDVHIYHGDKGSAEVHPPVVLGHEFAGTVVRTGKDVHGIREGDHVTVDPNIYCGKCHYCRIGKKHLCTSLFAIGVNRNGGFAEFCAGSGGRFDRVALVSDIRGGSDGFPSLLHTIAQLRERLVTAGRHAHKIEVEHLRYHAASSSPAGERLL